MFKFNNDKLNIAMREWDREKHDYPETDEVNTVQFLFWDCTNDKQYNKLFTALCDIGADRIAYILR